MESKKPRLPGKADLPPSFNRGGNEKVKWIEYDTDPKDVAEMLRPLRHGDIDATPLFEYRIMIHDTLEHVDHVYIKNLPLEVTELIADPISFYREVGTIIHTFALSATAHGKMLSEAAEGRAVTTRRRLMYRGLDGIRDEDIAGFQIEVDGKWHPLNAETPEAYLHDSDAAATAAAEDVK